MNKTIKKIKTQILCFLMLFCMFGSALPVMADGDRYPNDEAGARKFYNEILWQQWADQLPAPDPSYSADDIVKIWDQLYPYVDQSYGAYTSGGFHLPVELVSKISSLLKGDTGDNDKPDTSDDGEGFEWILPLEVLDNFSARNTAGKAAGISMTLCQQFGGAILIVGFMQLFLSFRNDDPGLKERALKCLYTGVFLVGIYALFRAMEMIG